MELIFRWEKMVNITKVLTKRTNHYNNQTTEVELLRIWHVTCLRRHVSSVTNVNNQKLTLRTYVKNINSVL